MNSRPPLDLDELFAPLRAVRMESDRYADIARRLGEPVFDAYPRPGLAALLPSLAIPLAACLLAVMRLAGPVAQSPGAWGTALLGTISAARRAGIALFELAAGTAAGLFTALLKVLQGLPLPSGSTSVEAATSGSLLILSLLLLVTLLATSRELRSGMPERNPTP